MKWSVSMYASFMPLRIKPAAELKGGNSSAGY